MIIAFEGVDGAGKNTLVTAVAKKLESREVPVAKLGFPRYEHSVMAQLAQAALHKNMGDLTESINGMATLFALDRHEVAEELAELDAEGYVILLDRFTASNAAYSAARSVLRDEQDGESEHSELVTHPIVQWVADLEFDTLGIPEPDHQVLVDVEAEVAAERAEKREAADVSRTRDAYEANSRLQKLTVAAYRGLAAAQWRSPWTVANATAGDTSRLASEIADLICRDLVVD